MTSKKILSILLVACMLFVCMLTTTATETSSEIEYDSVVAANTATILTEGVTWETGTVHSAYSTSEQYRLKTSGAAEFVFTGLNASDFKLIVAEHSGLNNVCKFEVSYDGETFEAVDNMTVNITNTHFVTNVGTINDLEYVSPTFEKAVKAVKVIRGNTYASDSNGWRFSAVALHLKSVPIVYDVVYPANTASILTEGVTWETGTVHSAYSTSEQYRLKTSGAAEFVFTGLNASDFKLIVAEYSGLNNVCKFEVSYDGETFEAVDNMTVNRINHPTREMHELFAESLFELIFSNKDNNLS